MRRLCIGVMAAFVFAFAQHGALVHELSHLKPTDAERQVEKQSKASDRCETCFSFSHIAVGASPASVAYPLLSHLAFAAMATTTFVSAANPVPQRRGQGPPQQH